MSGTNYRAAIFSKCSLVMLKDLLTLPELHVRLQPESFQIDEKNNLTLLSRKTSVRGPVQG